MEIAVRGGSGASYLPAIHAQELPGRLLDGTNKILKYMKA